MTNREGFALAAKALAGNPYDGHTLATTVEQIVALAGIAPEPTTSIGAIAATTTRTRNGSSSPDSAEA